jgi:TPP-dependent pyruvate/acetoin dehydrogenase alpha subunit
LNYWWKKCPIKRFKASLLKKGIFDEKRDHEIVQEVKEEINQAVTFADESAYPQPEEIFEDVYAHGTIRGGRLCMR